MPWTEIIDGTTTTDRRETIPIRKALHYEARESNAAIKRTVISTAFLIAVHGRERNWRQHISVELVAADFAGRIFFRLKRIRRS
jgi:hypothetical protein|tara:strand:- start:1603 stop:1854 length:252 start_codon:yes stop_codon:yes gene_type:complete